MKTKELNQLLEDFEDYCKNDIISGKARSYKLAVKYLCNCLGITMIDSSAMRSIITTTFALKEGRTHIYDECLQFLTNRGQSSHLLKGWINAAVAHFTVFMNSME
jgi:hypothetical protein